MTLTSSRIASLVGTLRPPSDKSITHRALMLGGLAPEPCIVGTPLRSHDTECTLNAMIELGLRHEVLSDGRLRLVPPRRLEMPRRPIDCGNSGTTMRLLSGLIAGQGLGATLYGDASLSRRPMDRVVDPLSRMGADISGKTAPISIKPAPLHGIDYASPISSAQVKSCLLLATLGAEGVTRFSEPSLSRNHTEIMFEGTGIAFTRKGTMIEMRGGQRPRAFEMNVPADISSAAFFAVGATLISGSRVRLLQTSVNPTRSGLLDVLSQAGALYELSDATTEAGEPAATLEVRCSPRLRPFQISGELVPRLVDEIPILALLATQCDGVSTICDAGEARVKESDRLKGVADGLNAMGARVELHGDGLTIHGPTPLSAATIDATGDHRIAMTFMIAGLIAGGTTTILGADSIATSYPHFVHDLESLIIV